MIVRSEQPRDQAAVRAVNEAAFGTSEEADLIDALRAKVPPLLSLVAVIEGRIVGHIVFSPVSFVDHAGPKIMGLGPMAVVPEEQRKGIGSALVRTGLEQCEQQGCDAVVVVGHPEYYPRFGFVPAASYAITCEYDVPEDVFMIVELRPGALRDVSGLLLYDDVFR